MTGLMLFKLVTTFPENSIRCRKCAFTWGTGSTDWKNAQYNKAGRNRRWVSMFSQKCWSVIAMFRNEVEFRNLLLNRGLCSTRCYRRASMSEEARKPVSELMLDLWILLFFKINFQVIWPIRKRKKVKELCSFEQALTISLVAITFPRARVTNCIYCGQHLSFSSLCFSVRCYHTCHTWNLNSIWRWGLRQNVYRLWSGTIYYSFQFETKPKCKNSIMIYFPSPIQTSSVYVTIDFDPFYETIRNTLVITKENQEIVLYKGFWMQRCWELYSIAVQILTRDFLFFHDCQFIDFVSEYVVDHLTHTFWSSVILLVTIGIDWSAKGITRILRWFFQLCGRLVGYLFHRAIRIVFNQDTSLSFQAVCGEVFLFSLCCGWSNSRSCPTSELINNACCYDSLDPRLNILEKFFSIRFVLPSYSIRSVVNVTAHSWDPRGLEYLLWTSIVHQHILIIFENSSRCFKR